MARIELSKGRRSSSGLGGREALAHHAAAAEPGAFAFITFEIEEGTGTASSSRAAVQHDQEERCEDVPDVNVPTPPV
jgi:hypothetical protein